LFSLNLATLYGGKGGFKSDNANKNEVKCKINKDGSFVVCEEFLIHFLQSKKHTAFFFCFSQRILQGTGSITLLTSFFIFYWM